MEKHKPASPRDSRTMIALVLLIVLVVIVVALSLMKKPSAAPAKNTDAPVTVTIDRTKEAFPSLVPSITSIPLTPTVKILRTDTYPHPVCITG